eukprot:NODE_3944_length_890_cov_22.736029_g3632_i0.p2 GENE.NODE_3944_length_890_cov_22.736029_g3632_i0~~NODE_3944_length_890_cov_22.736029_g3632_i0.p2  ORF type:complete len:205 (+),score=41.33 NODE_3944_length_890_cov_22.736029_g3632_i0:155-769(+)
MAGKNRHKKTNKRNSRMKFLKYTHVEEERSHEMYSKLLSLAGITPKMLALKQRRRASRQRKNRALNAGKQIAYTKAVNLLVDTYKANRKREREVARGVHGESAECPAKRQKKVPKESSPPASEGPQEITVTLGFDGIKEEKPEKTSKKKAAVKPTPVVQKKKQPSGLPPTLCSKYQGMLSTKSTEKRTKKQKSLRIRRRKEPSA